MDKIWIKNGKFTALEKEQIKTLSADDILDYNEAKNQNLIANVEAKMAELMQKADFENFKKELNQKDTQGKIEELAKTVKRVALGVKETETKSNSIKDALQKIYAEKGNFKGAEISVKADVTRASIADNTTAYRLDGIGQLAGPMPVLTEVFSARAIPADHHGNISYIDWDADTIVRAADAVAEGALFDESTAAWVEKSEKAEKIGDTIPVTEEALQDIMWMEQELTRFLSTNILRKQNAFIFNGSGAVNQPSGVYTSAPAFDPLTYTGATTTSPDLANLAMVLRTEIMDGKDDKYFPDAVFVSHTDYLQLLLAKDGEQRLQWNAATLAAVGMRFIPTSYVPAGTLLVGDTRYFNVWSAETANISIGVVDKQFTMDMLTMKAKVRMATVMREADKDGWLKVTNISDAFDAITKTEATS